MAEIQTVKIKIAFTVDDVVQDRNRQHSVTSGDIRKLMEGAQTFLIAMVQKSLERSPLYSTLLKSANLFDPDKS